MGLKGDIHKVAEQELGGFQVSFDFETDTAPYFLAIKTPEGREKRIRYSLSPRGCNLQHFRGDLRRAVRELGAEPKPDKRRPRRVGTLGEAFLEATRAPDPISTEATTGDKPMTSDPSLSTKPAPKTEAASRVEHQKLLRGEIALLSRLLTVHAKTDFDKKEVEYLDGWSDARLLAILREDPERHLLRIDHVVNFRREFNGTLQSERDAAAAVAEPTRNVAALIAILRKKIESLEGRVQSLEDAATTPQRS